MTNKRKPLKFTILTIFPEAFSSLKVGILGRALRNNLWELEIVDLKTVKNLDGRPAGGGNGMVFRADKLAMFEHKFSQSKYYLSPSGKPFDQNCAYELSKLDHITLLCGRYEGVDCRFIDQYEFKEISIGDYILAGGEIAAAVLVESTVRLLDGTMNNSNSTVEESFDSQGPGLEHNHYTMPRKWGNRGTPALLLSGHNEKIEQYRLAESLINTQKKRPDLYKKFLVKFIMSQCLCIIIKYSKYYNN